MTSNNMHSALRHIRHCFINWRNVADGEGASPPSSSSMLVDYSRLAWTEVEQHASCEWGFWWMGSLTRAWVNTPTERTSTNDTWLLTRLYLASAVQERLQNITSARVLKMFLWNAGSKFIANPTRWRGWKHYQGYVTHTSRAEKCIFPQGQQVMEYSNFRAAVHYCVCARVGCKTTNTLLKAHKHGFNCFC